MDKELRMLEMNYAIFTPIKQFEKSILMKAIYIVALFSLIWNNCLHVEKGLELCSF